MKLTETNCPLIFEAILHDSLVITVTWIILTYVIFTGFHPSDIGELLMTIYFYINVFIIILVPWTAIHLVYMFLIVVQGMPMNTSSMSQGIALR